MDIITSTKVVRFKWVSHVIRWDQQQRAERILIAKPEGRKRGRPKMRWEDRMDNDVKILGERNWKNLAMNR
jgi:hypothetical protein